MINKDKIIKSAVTAFLAITASYSSISEASDTTTSTEKCYGVVKAGFNDCATANSTCASSSTKDNQADAFVFVPKGLCEKLVGGHLESGKKTSS